MTQPFDVTPLLHELSRVHDENEAGTEARDEEGENADPEAAKLDLLSFIQDCPPDELGKFFINPQLLFRVATILAPVAGLRV